MMLATTESLYANWSLVALLCSVIIALAGVLARQLAARFASQNKRHEELRRIFYEYMGASRERAAQIEASVVQIDKKFDHNIPQLWDHWQEHCTKEHGGACGPKGG